MSAVFAESFLRAFGITFGIIAGLLVLPAVAAAVVFVAAWAVAWIEDWNANLLPPALRELRFRIRAWRVRRGAKRMARQNRKASHGSGNGVVVAGGGRTAGNGAESQQDNGLAFDQADVEDAARAIAEAIRARGGS